MRLGSESPDVAMVFAAGFGRRMLPITNKIPKPLVKVGGKALIDYNLDMLARAGVSRVVVNTHHLSDLLEKHLNQRSLPLVVEISHEVDILETGGGVVKALPMLGDKPFYSVNSDTILLDGENSLSQMAKVWDSLKMDALMLLVPIENAVGYDGVGDFELCDDGRISKPVKGSYKYVFSGVMILNPLIFAGVEEKPFSIYRDFLHEKYIQADYSLNRVYGVVHDKGWLHIGTPDSVGLAENCLKIEEVV